MRRQTELRECSYCGDWHSAYDLCDPILEELKADYTSGFVRWLERRAARGHWTAPAADTHLPDNEQWFAPQARAAQGVSARLRNIDRLFTETQPVGLQPRGPSANPMQEGQPHGRSPIYDQGTVRRHYSGSGEAMVATWSERRSPAREAHFSSDVLVPLSQAGISAAIVALVGGAVFAAVWRFLSDSSPAMADVLAVAGALGLMALVALWFRLLDDSRAGLWHVERVESGLPAQSDPPPAAEPQRQTIGVRLDIEEERPEVGGLHRVVLQELDISPSDLKTVARMINGGRSFSVRSLCGSGPLTEAQLESLRGFLMERGFMAWVNESNRRSGVTLTASGKRLFARLAGDE